MRRVVDGLLIVCILAAVAIGAYYIGNRVDTESNNLAKQDLELNQKTNSAAKQTKSNRTPIIIGIGIGGAVVALVLASLTNSFVRARRRERWHAT